MNGDLDLAVALDSNWKYGGKLGYCFGFGLRFGFGIDLGLGFGLGFKFSFVLDWDARFDFEGRRPRDCRTLSFETLRGPLATTGPTTSKITVAQDNCSAFFFSWRYLDWNLDWVVDCNLDLNGTLYPERAGRTPKYVPKPGGFGTPSFPQHKGRPETPGFRDTFWSSVGPLLRFLSVSRLLLPPRLCPETPGFQD